MQKEDTHIVSPDFDWKVYLNNYEDLRQNGINTEEKAIDHWVKHGRDEGRVYSHLINEDDMVPDDFNWKLYMENYEDLPKAGYNTKAKLWKHWEKHGKVEGRKHLIQKTEEIVKIPYYFDSKVYMSNYPLIKKVLSSKEDCWLHYSKVGKNKGNIYVNKNEYIMKLYILYTYGRDIVDVDTSLINKKDITSFSNYIHSQGISFDKLEIYIMLEQFYKEVYNFTLDLKNAYKLVLQERKDHYRYLCYRYINYINTFKITNLFDEEEHNETVLIEFRSLRNVEFVVKNTMLKLPNWKHTIICGNNNYDFFTSIFKDVDVNIIKVDIDDCTVDCYSKLLTSTYFWNLLTGQHILIYQDDTFLFSSEIDKWLKYDYVGAPWPQEIYPVGYRVGNGGFSLRKRKLMLYITEKYDISSFPFFEFTKKYMRENNLKIIPEDCFFVKCIKDFNLGKIPDETESTYFSSESVKNYESLGMHCCWLSDSNWVERFLSSIKKLHCNNINMLSDFNHRFGWNSLLRTLYINDIISLDDQSIQFVDLCEKYFLWDDKRIEEGKKWIGIVHLTPTAPSNLQSIDETLNCKNFKDAMKDCLCIIVFAEYLREYLKKINNFPPIKFMYHPILTQVSTKFNFSKFLEGKRKKIVQIGKQLRVLKTFLITNFPSYEKIWLIGSYDSIPEISSRLNYEFNESVNLEDFDVDYKVVNSQKYDEYFTDSIIFMHVYDAVANNTVLESILYKTPIIINKHPAVVEYLGEDYPLYFSEEEELTEDFLTKEKILSAHQHLCNIDMTQFSYMTFFNSLTSLI
jgi:hypothetical protein